MKVAYVDTSCVVALAFSESGHEELVQRLERVDRLVSSNLLEAEFAAALARENVEDSHDLLARLHWIFPHRPLTSEIRELLGHGQARGADLWHLACALRTQRELGELQFLSLDGQQNKLARRVGLT